LFSTAFSRVSQAKTVVPFQIYQAHTATWFRVYLSGVGANKREL